MVIVLNFVITVIRFLSVMAVIIVKIARDVKTVATVSNAQIVLTAQANNKNNI